jgi:FkbM family methyltransferase
MVSLTTDVSHTFYKQFRVLTHDKGISHHIINGCIWEKNLLDLMIDYVKHDSVVLDIGANIGCHTIGLNNMCNDMNIRIESFEPQPIIYDILEQNITFSDNTNMIPHKVGLGSSNTTIYTTMPNYYTCDNPGGFGLTYGDKLHQTDIEIEIRTLDSYNFENVSLIKIDVECHEGQVIEGAKDTIHRCRPVMFVEILGGTHYDKASIDQRNYIDGVKQMITELGYNIQLILNSDYLCIPVTPLVI